MDSVNQIDRPLGDSAYDTDFYLWTLDQAARLRALNAPQLDTENLAEEIESVGRSDKRELSSRSVILLVHLLKWRFQPERRGESWISTIGEQRISIEAVLRDSPSLRPAMPRVITESYRRAVVKAAEETGLRRESFPASSQWTPEQILDYAFRPD